ncbi:RipA family octameric membrane protein [Nocardia rhizosphaerihabitans]|uniref:Membrane protein n=1 Tax=Nocardia rhizosphaerihabitans TaxID=1691570 RepID=A0ABQ2KND4_9NOCA|nr:hypothetical protein [Nocardia rhizosphaerihabitans]GGN87537.1 membrane protein [Nocardia rhizosphaerihabitans]
MTHNDQRSELSNRLWNQSPESGVPEGHTAAYDNAVLEQYRLYVEMTDRVSARRGLANSFFLSLNTGIFTLASLFGKSPPPDTAKWLVIPLIAILGQCFAWFYLVRSYRLLNSAKFQVIGALEERLPASPFWKAEWWALGEGRNRALYWPLSHIEQWVPVLFALAYVSGFLAIAFH